MLRDIYIGATVTSIGIYIWILVLCKLLNPIIKPSYKTSK